MSETNHDRNSSSSEQRDAAKASLKKKASQLHSGKSSSPDDLDSNDKDELMDENEDSVSDSSESPGGSQGDGGGDDKGEEKGSNPIKAANEKKKSLNKTLRKIQMAAMAASMAFRAYMAAKLFQIMQMLFMMMAMMAQAIAAAAVSVVTAIVNAVTTAITAVAAFFAVSAAVAAGGLAVVAVVLVVGLVGIFVTYDDVATKDSAEEECVTDIDWSRTEVDDVGGDTLANAQRVYDVFKAYGYENENIAGILGNWEYESGIDPTGVETIYDEPFSIGPRKAEAWHEHDFLIDLIDPDYADRFPAIEYCGIGLGQWTNGRNRLLVDYAADLNATMGSGSAYEWYQLEVQLAFMISPEGDSSASILEGWEPEDSPESAAEWFNVYWEGIPYNAARGEAAAQWFVRMAEWEADVEYGNSIIEMAGATMVDASESGVSGSLDNCDDVTIADNSTLANAAVAYAWLSSEEGLVSDGTGLYQCLHQTFWPGDPYFQSCDRSVAVAVLWSGADGDFPRGSTANQISYLSTSEYWEHVYDGEERPVDPDDLLPGDILIRWDGPGGRTHHIVMYVGNEAVKAKFPDAPDNYVIVSGSIGSVGTARSPNCGPFYYSSAGYDGLETYQVFRNVRKNPNPEYTNVTCAGCSGTSEDCTS